MSLHSSCLVGHHGNSEHLPWDKSLLCFLLTFNSVKLVMYTAVNYITSTSVTMAIIHYQNTLMNQMALFIGTQYSQRESSKSSFLLKPGICMIRDSTQTWVLTTGWQKVLWISRFQTKKHKNFPTEVHLTMHSYISAYRTSGPAVKV